MTKAEFSSPHNTIDSIHQQPKKVLKIIWNTLKIMVKIWKVSHN